MDLRQNEGGEEDDEKTFYRSGLDGARMRKRGSRRGWGRASKIGLGFGVTLYIKWTQLYCESATKLVSLLVNKRGSSGP